MSLIAANKKQNPTDTNTFKKQRKIVVKLNKKIKRSFVNGLSLKTDNAVLWGKCTTYFIMNIIKI